MATVSPRCRMRTIPLVSTRVLFAGAARAEEQGQISAAEVASWCEPYRTAVLSNNHVTVKTTAQSPVCWGAFLAIQQLGSIYERDDSSESILRTCSPPNSRLTEFIKIFLRYSDEHPERGHEKFIQVALDSLWKAYPCSARPSGKH
jgi:Rap1a immunity proteins